MEEAFNAAINFALDEAGGEGLGFLELWREGDWHGIAKDFPEFYLSTTGQSNQKQGALDIMSAGMGVDLQRHS